MWLGNNVSLDWWDDNFFYEGVNLLMTKLYLDDIKENDISRFMFEHFKSKAIDGDRSLDSHIILNEIIDTEDAEVYSDELTIFKTAALLYYFYRLNTDKFLNSIKKLLKCKTASFKDFCDIYSENQPNANLNQLKFYLGNKNISKLSYVKI